MSNAATVAEITEEDIPEVADFLARQVRPGEATAAGQLTPIDRLRWLLLKNPARAADIPMGWHIRNEAGMVVGANVCVPFRVAVNDVACTALMFAKFYVDLPYRGMGLGMLMRFVREGKRFPLFCTSTNAISSELFAKVGGEKIPGMGHTMLGVARPRSAIEEWIFRRSGSPLLARLASQPSAFAPSRIKRLHRLAICGELVPLRSADEAAAIPFYGSGQSSGGRAGSGFHSVAIFFRGCG